MTITLERLAGASIPGLKSIRLDTRDISAVGSESHVQDQTMNPFN